ncbi:hypothetical protein BGZ88_010502 [Linnemannia elongata]|nr:hypothetical protein BGZ88_010502 [Linnemannia elongata]
MSLCNRWIVSGYWENTVTLWNLAAWSPTVPMEFVTGCRDESVRVWRVSSDSEDVVVRLLWGTNLAVLHTDGLVLKGTTGLRLMQKKLLVQRGAIGDSLTEGDKQDDYTDSEWVEFDDYTDSKDVESDDYTDSYWFESGDSTDFEGVESDDEE